MKDFLTLKDYSKEQILEMIDLATEIKLKHKSGIQTPLLQNKTLGMIFEKSSTRTRVSFEVGIYQLGGMGLFLSSNDIQLSRGEPIKDTARVVGSMVDMVMIRTFEHTRLEEFASFCPVPVINGLSDSFHPVQLMADYLTMVECNISIYENKPIVAYVGDGNNIAHSWLMLASKLGFELRISSPKGYEVNAEIYKFARDFAQESGAKIVLLEDPREAISGANVVTTDTWASMGCEDQKEMRKSVFKDYQINQEMMDLAQKDAIFLHCLPAYRGQEVSDEVIEGKQSRVFLEAENRLHVQKGIMVYLHQKSKKGVQC